MPERKIFINIKSHEINASAGNRYSLLTVIREVKRKDLHGRFVLCECDCGNLKEISLRDLKRGNAKSCGCLKKYDTSNNDNFHNKSNTRIYSIWSDMKSRCFNEKNSRFERYGGRGISTCKEWLEFDNFYKWSIDNGYNDELTIDRADNNGDYNPKNCKWSTQKEQARNRSTTIRVERDGIKKSLREWCEIEGVEFNMVYRRLRRGWDIEDAFNVPSIARGKKYAN